MADADPIRVALERLVSAYDSNEGLPIAEWIAAARAALARARPAHDTADRLQQVAVSERPWKRPGWCDAQGQCWMGDPGGAGYIAAWLFCVPESARSMSVSLPADALPLPKLPSDPVANELSDEQLLQMAAAATGYEAIAPGQYEQGEFEGHGTAVEVYRSELIAYGRAVWAACRARQEEKANG